MDNMAEVFRKKFATYRKLLDEADEKTAWDTVFQGYPERQKANMGPMIDGTTLTAGFSLAIPNYKKMGMDMVIYDISNNGQDAVLEIQKSCPVLDNGWHTEFGFEKPCRVICEMDIAATEAAFPNIKGAILARMADGNCVCLFKYERPK
jgi:hypothetical protein